MKDTKQNILIIFCTRKLTPPEQLACFSFSVLKIVWLILFLFLACLLRNSQANSWLTSMNTQHSSHVLSFLLVFLPLFSVPLNRLFNFLSWFLFICFIILHDSWSSYCFEQGKVEIHFKVRLCAQTHSVTFGACILRMEAESWVTHSPWDVSRCAVKINWRTFL